jgi:hypothetical protein
MGSITFKRAEAGYTRDVLCSDTSLHHNVKVYVYRTGNIEKVDWTIEEAGASSIVLEHITRHPVYRPAHTTQTTRANMHNI